MARKIVVIDGMARSGTTLLASMIHSQHNSACYRGIFHEFLACDIGIWKKDYALYNLQETNNHIVFKKKKRKFYKYLTKLSKNLYLQFEGLIDNTVNIIEKRNQTGKLKLHEWKRAIHDSKVSSLDDLDLLYQDIAKLNNVNLLAMRWNQSLPYINKFLRNENHYWISVIRNPMDRAISDHKTFNEKYNDALMYTANYGKILDKTHHLNNHIMVYFEDLVCSPEKELIKLYDKIGISLDTVNLDLKTQSGEVYQTETSDLIDKGMKHTEGEKFSGFDMSKTNKWKAVLDKNIINNFIDIFNTYKVYKRYINS